VSANSVDALYWLGRNAERGGNPARARSYYSKAIERFPQTYFGNAAAARFAKLGPGEENPAELLEKIPPRLRCVLLMSRSRLPPRTAGPARSAPRHRL